MELDVEKLKVIAEWLEAGAPHDDDGMAFNMDYWHNTAPFGELDVSQPWVGECGSVACIGGTLEQLFGVDYEHFPWELGASQQQVDQLFYPWDTNSFYMGSGYLSPENCAKVIYNLIETGEVDWSII